MAAAAHEAGITQRVAASGSRDDGASDRAAAVSGPNKKPGGGGRASSSRRGLRSLAAAVSLSAALTALSFFAASHSSPSPKAATASTVAVVRAGSVASEAVLALAAWMAWAEGGVHARPASTLLPYAAQLGAALAWALLVVGHGATRAGLACCAAMAAAAVACARGFGAVNPVAGDLAKPAVAWAVILAVVNYKML
ncbi:translocator protein homolog [Miscanthus floridulus]|uniref:translocator protein homolog n=1 Tax=Miscanthus floridulus TaxID=154761 RepID=UPI0034578381